jgi:hypothetical protein
MKNLIIILGLLLIMLVPMFTVLNETSQTETLVRSITSTNE